MKTIVKDEYLKKEGRKQGDFYKLGFLAQSSIAELKKQGYVVQKDELVGWFNGVRNFIEFVKRKDYGKIAEGYNSSHDQERSGDWTRLSTYQQAEKKALEEPQYFREYTESDIRIKDFNNSGNDVDYSNTGDFVDVGRVLAGEPECFGIMRNGNIIQDFCSIVISGNACARVEAKTLVEKSKRVLRLVDLLEANHIRCELSIVFSNDNSHCEIVIKNYNDILDIDDLAVALSPDFFRRFQFAFTEHSADTITWGYGRSECFKAETFKDDDANATIYINSQNDNDIERINKEFDSLEEQIAEKGLIKDKAYKVL